MKKKILVGLFSLCAVLSYKAYASLASDGDNESNGCVGKGEYNCQVWYVTPEGVGIILEEGVNGDDVDEEDPEKP